MARKAHNIHYIYKITCNVTGKYYIGMHSTSNLYDGYMGSGKRLRFSIRYHGKENHIKEILEYYESREELAKREREIVNLELIKEDLCLNLCVGGDGGRGFTSDEAKKGRVATDNRLLEKYGPNFRTIINLKYHNSMTEDEKIVFGKKIRDGQQKNGYDNKSFEGKTHSEESKQLMSESSKGNGIGENNSQYGTCWVTREGVNKKIKKEALETFINNGWIKGRKI